MFKNTKRKFQQLNQEPEDVRIRAAVRISIAAGIIIIPLALLVLLPLQFKVQQARNEGPRRASSQNNESQSIISRLKQFTSRQAGNEETNISAPQVGGVSDISKQGLSFPDFPSLNTSQNALNYGAQMPRLAATPPPEIKSFNTNNIPVEITP